MLLVGDDDDAGVVVDPQRGGDAAGVAVDAQQPGRGGDAAGGAQPLPGGHRAHPRRRQPVPPQSRGRPAQLDVADGRPAPDAGRHRRLRHPQVAEPGRVRRGAPQTRHRQFEFLQNGRAGTHLCSFQQVSEQFQSNFKAISEQFQSNFRAFSGHFQSCSRAVSEQF